MKKYFAIISLALAAMVSCNKIDEHPQDEGKVNPSVEAPDGKVLVTFNADMAVPAPEGVAKTTVESDGTVLWEAGDEIEVWYLADNTPKHFTATAATAGESSKFSGAMDEGDAPSEFWAAYPKDAGELKYEGGAGKFNITVTNTDGTFKGANFMAAYSTSEAKSFAFKNAVGIVKIALPDGGVISHGGADYTINGLRIRGKSNAFNHKGTVQVVLNSANTAVESFSSEVTGGAANVYVNFGDEVRNSGFVYLPSLPGTLADGFGVKYYAQGGKNIPGILSKDTEVTFTRGHIKPLKDLTSKIVWDYYVSASGTGDGLSADNPMSIEQFVASITLEDKRNDKDVVFMAYGNPLNGATFHFTPGTHSISSAITLPSKNIYAEATYYTITGDGNAILDGGGSSRIFDITAACDRTTISYLTLTNGSSEGDGGLVRISNAGPVFRHCNFTNTVITSTSKSGGAVRVDAAAGNGAGIFEDCTFSGNLATGGGGAVVITNNNTSLSMTRCTFENNTAESTGGGAFYTTNGISELVDCIFSGNSSNKAGGAVLSTTGTLRARGCRFLENYVKTLGARGGAVDINGTGTIYFDKCYFRDNYFDESTMTKDLNSGLGFDIKTGNVGSTLCMHNSTIHNTKMNTNSSWKLTNNCSVATIGYCIIVNSTLHGDGKNMGRGCFSVGYNGVAEGDSNKSVLCNNLLKHEKRPAVWSNSTSYSLKLDYNVMNAATLGTHAGIVNGEHNYTGALTLGSLDDTAGYFAAPALPAGYTAPTKQQIESILAANPKWEAFSSWLGDEWGKDQAGNSRGSDDSSVWTPGSIQ